MKAWQTRKGERVALGVKSTARQTKSFSKETSLPLSPCVLCSRESHTLLQETLTRTQKNKRTQESELTPKT